MLNTLILKTFLLSLAAYALGSLSFALLVSKLKKIDLTKIGSGNLGATNVYRALGFKYALLVFSLDAFKGFLPTYLATPQFFSQFLPLIQREAWVLLFLLKKRLPNIPQKKHL